MIPMAIPFVIRLLHEAEQRLMAGTISQSDHQLAASAHPGAVGLPYIGVLRTLSAQTAAVVIVLIVRHALGRSRRTARNSTRSRRARLQDPKSLIPAKRELDRYGTT